MEAILQFWLDEVGPKGWYRVDGEVDRQISNRFGEAWERVARHGCGGWAATAEGALALLILLDQFPRNMFRGTARAYSTDVQARATAKHAVDRGLDRQVEEPARQFFYLPLMHSESLQDQERCVRLCLLRMPQTGEDNLDHAVKHRDVIRRFGRFPSRNAALGRRDTRAELRYREEGGYMS